MPAAQELPGGSGGSPGGGGIDGGHGDAGPTGGGGSSGGPPGSGLPCDVNQILVANCQSCHGATPSGGAPMALLTYADLAAPGKTAPSQTMAALSVSRITSANAPMPPSPPPLSAADIATFKNWVNAGMPMGSCNAPTTPDPLGAAPTCTSGQTWPPGDEGDAHMNPGEACISCHMKSKGEARVFTIAGTVYPTGHEPDRCYGTGTGQVVIVDAKGIIQTLIPNDAGNFSSEMALTLPYQAKVVANGKTRAMSAPQMSGDCNFCHTQNGASGAPGRITLP